MTFLIAVDIKLRAAKEIRALHFKKKNESAIFDERLEMCGCGEENRRIGFSTLFRNDAYLNPTQFSCTVLEMN